MADNTEIVGGVGIEISGIYDGLAADFDAAVAVAVSKGATMQEAMASALKVPDTTPMTDMLDIMSARFNAVEAAANPAGDAIKAAGAAAGGATAAVHDLGDAAQHAAEHGHSAAESFGELGSELLKIGGLVLTIEGLMDLGKEAMGAADGITRATISLTAMTGSGETAKETIEGLEKVAMDDGLSMPSLLTAAQRLQNMLPAGTDVVDVLAHVADGAAVMGKDIEASSQAFYRLVESGNVSVKTMSQMGLTTEDLKEAMIRGGQGANVLELGVKGAFQALDDQSKVQAAIDAFERLNGIAKTITDETFGGNWNRVMLEAHKDLALIGDGMSPIIAAMPAMKSAIDYLTAGIVMVGTSIKLVVDGVVGLTSVALEAIKAFGNAWYDILTGNFKALHDDTISAFDGIKSASKFSWDSMVTDATSGGNTLLTIWQGMQDGANKSATATDGAEKAHKTLTNTVQDSLPVITNVHNATKLFLGDIQSVPSAEQAAAEATDAHNAKLGLLAQSLVNANKLLDQTWAGYQIGQNSAKQLADAQDGVLKAQAAIDKEVGDNAKPAIASMNQAFTDWTDANKATKDSLMGIPGAIAPIKPALDPIQEAWKTLGFNIDGTIKSTKDTEAAFDTLAAGANLSLPQVNALWEKVSGSVSKIAKTDLPEAIRQQGLYVQALINAGAPLGQIEKAEADRLQNEITLAHQNGQDASDYLIALDKIKDKLAGPGDSLYQAYKDVQKIVKDTFDQVEKSIASSIVDGKNLEDSLVQAGKNIAKEFIEDLLKLALQPVEKSLLNLAGTLFPSVAAGAASAGQQIGSLATSASTAATQTAQLGSAASGASSAASSVGGAFGSLGGTINVVSGAVSAVTGVIGLFQNAAMESTMKLVELNTRISAIVEQKELPLSNQIAVEQEGTLNAIWASMLDTATSQFGRLGDIWDQLREIQQHIDLTTDEVNALRVDLGASMGSMLLAAAKQAALTSTGLAGVSTTAASTTAAVQSSATSVTAAVSQSQAKLDALKQQAAELSQQLLVAENANNAEAIGAITAQLSSVAAEITNANAALVVAQQQAAAAIAGAVYAGRTDTTTAIRAAQSAQHGDLSTTTTAIVDPIHALMGGGTPATTSVVTAINSTTAAVGASSQAAVAAIAASQAAQSAAIAASAASFGQIIAAIPWTPPAASGGGGAAAAPAAAYGPAHSAASFYGNQFDYYNGIGQQGNDTAFGSYKAAYATAQQSAFSVPVNVVPMGSGVGVIAANPDGTVSLLRNYDPPVAYDSSFVAPPGGEWHQMLDALGISGMAAQAAAVAQSAIDTAKASAASATKGIAPIISKASLPSFDIGGLVPYDMIARVHEGEVITPRSQVNNMNQPLTVNFYGITDVPQILQKISTVLKRQDSRFTQYSS